MYPLAGWIREREGPGVWWTAMLRDRFLLCESLLARGTAGYLINVPLEVTLLLLLGRHWGGPPHGSSGQKCYDATRALSVLSLGC